MDESAVKLEVRVIDQQLSRRLRRDVLRPGLPLDGPLPGDEVADAVHLAAFDGDRLASTCLIYPDPCPDRPAANLAWHLRQMATEPDLRGTGAGRAVIEFCLSWLGERQADVLWCNARETAVGFYRRLGFVGVGDLFTDQRHPIPHLRMVRDL